LCDHSSSPIKENASGLSQLNTTRFAAKELNAEFGFNGLDPLAERRLLHA
jgi:hypothetical protein